MNILNQQQKQFETVNFEEVFELEKSKEKNPYEVCI